MNTSLIERSRTSHVRSVPSEQEPAAHTVTEAQHAPTMSHVLNVPAVRGRMGHTTYYTANFPIGMVVKLFTYDPDKMSGLAVEDRHQRALQKNRIPAIASYMLQDDYVFSSITVSVSTDGMSFQPSAVDDNVGILGIPMETDWIVNDGQHRLAGMALALTKNNELRHDTISVVILPDEGLERSQQVFSDLNRTVQKTSKSLDILFDKRSPVNRIANSLVDTVPLFVGKVDKERAVLPSKSDKFCTLSTVQAATAALFGHLPEHLLVGNYDGALSVAEEFWGAATGIITPWADIASGKLEPSVGRSKYLSCYALLLTAVAAVGSDALQTDNWRTALEPLHDINYLKSNKEWQDRGMQGTDVVASVTTRRAIVAFLKERMLPPPAKEPAANPPVVRRGRPRKVA